MSRYAIVHAKVLDFLRTQPDNTFDALLCDPPYGLRFMNKRWDYDVPSVAEWAECLRVLKPGAPILAFGGSRTFHRIFVGLEDAGAELCDTIMWIYGQGMPKPATTTDKYLKTPGEGPWQGYGHALRPSHEPIALACKPYDGTIAENVRRWGVGALNVGACRLGGVVTINRWRDGAHPFGGAAGEEYETIQSEGRWPANVILTHSPECTPAGTREVRSSVATKGDSQAGHLFAYGNERPEGPRGYAKDGKETVEAFVCAPGCPIRLMDEQSGERPSTLSRVSQAMGAPGETVNAGVKYANPGDNGGASWYGGGNSAVYADNGGASRFFYHAKVNRKERERGCEGLPFKSAAEATNRREGTVGADRPQAGAGRGSGCRNHHPTLKPIDLTRYLARLALPPLAVNPEAKLLQPWSGACSETIGALLAGWPNVLGIEREAEYLPIIHARVPEWVPGAQRLL